MPDVLFKASAYDWSECVRALLELFPGLLGNIIKIVSLFFSRCLVEINADFFDT